MPKTSPRARSLAILGLLPLLLAASPPFAKSSSAPVGLAPGSGGPPGALDGDFADPFVLHAGGSYLAFATGARGANVQVARSGDLVSWERLSDALPRLPDWASRREGFTWAPSVLPRGDGFVMYYTTRDEASGFQCISRAVSARPEGPYVDGSARPLVCQTGAEGALCGSIDPSPFVDDGGRAYLLWKSDENSASCKTAPRIWGQALSADGLALLGAPQALLAKDRPWEGTIIEGPSMVYRHGRYFLFYSANGYETPNYAVGYATCEGPLGPCAKKTVDAPWLGSRGDMLGPGGEELFAGANGETWMAYHAWSAPRTTYASGGSRSLRFARVTFGGDAPALTKGDPVAER